MHYFLHLEIDTAFPRHCFEVLREDFTLTRVQVCLYVFGFCQVKLNSDHGKQGCKVLLSSAVHLVFEILKYKFRNHVGWSHLYIKEKNK